MAKGGSTNGRRAPNGEVIEALRELLKAGLELGVQEAARRVAVLTGPRSEPMQADELQAVTVTRFVETVRDDAQGVIQLIKEVWSRGGAEERQTAARALGQALTKIAPHRALQLARELAAMSRTSKEADLVGKEAIAPILNANPPLYDRVKQLLRDNEVWVRRAAIAGLVAYVARKRKLTAVTLEIILVLAEENEKEIRAAVRAAVKELSAIDWKSAGRAIVNWAESDPARLGQAKRMAASAAVGVKKDVQAAVIKGLAKFANGASKPKGRAPKSAPSKKGPKAAAKKKSKKTRRR